MKLPEGEKQISQYIKTFLNDTRKRYFMKKLLAYFDDEVADSHGVEISEQKVFQCLVYVCDELFLKLAYFLHNQGYQLSANDITDLSDAFVDIFNGSNFQFNDRNCQIDDLGNWEEHMEMLLLEASNIYLISGKIGIDSVNDLAKTAVVNDLEESHRHDLISTFRSDVSSRIDGLIGIESYQRDELLDRTKYYCEEVFPVNCKEFSDPQECLSIWMTQISDFINENVDNFRVFLLDINRIEKACVKLLSTYDGLIEKHSDELREYIKEECSLDPSKDIQKIKFALVQIWLNDHVELNNEKSESIGRSAQFNLN